MTLQTENAEECTQCIVEKEKRIFHQAARLHKVRIVLDIES
jgi:hypothetical protein